MTSKIAVAYVTTEWRPYEYGDGGASGTPNKAGQAMPCFRRASLAV